MNNVKTKKSGMQFALVEIGGHYDNDYIRNLAMEECAELIQALSKLNRRVQAAEYINQEEELKDHLFEEIADVELCLQMLVNRYKCQEQVYDWKNRKIERWLARLNEC